MPARRGDNRDRLWPFGRGIALLVAGVVFVLLVAVVVALQQAGAMGTARMNLPFFVAIALVSLVPVFLVVLDTVVANQGAVEVPGGFKISFTDIRRSAAGEVSSVTMTANIMGVQGVALADTGGRALLEALQPIVGRDVVVLDLGEGGEWWRTRLLLLCSRAARVGSPAALVFTATMAKRPRRFLGWAAPDDVLRVLLSDPASPLARAYRVALARARKAELGEPRAGQPSLVDLPWSALSSPPGAAAGPPGRAIDNVVNWQSAPEQYLLQQLAELEPSGITPQPDLAVSVRTVRDEFAAIAHTASIDVAAPDDVWVSTVLGSTDAYIAVTSGDEYRYLLPRASATNAVLRAVVDQLRMTTGAAR